MNIESPSQVMTPAEWRARRKRDQAGGTLDEPTTLYLGAGGTTLGPALLVQAWPLDSRERTENVRIAHALIRGDEQHRRDCGRAPYRTWERGSCGTCALLGYGAHDEQHGTPAPNYAGWARVYVQAREAVPRAWRPAFVAELNTDDNDRYRDALRCDVASFGWSLTDERPGYRLRTPTADSVLGWLRNYNADIPGYDVAEELREIAADTIDTDYDAATRRAARRALARLDEEATTDAA